MIMLPNSWKLLVPPIVSMIYATKSMETIGTTNSFHNFHISKAFRFNDFWNYVLDSQSPQVIVPEIMETVEAIGSKNHGNYW